MHMAVLAALPGCRRNEVAQALAFAVLAVHALRKLEEATRPFYKWRGQRAPLRRNTARSQRSRNHLWQTNTFQKARNMSVSGVHRAGRMR